MCTGENDSKTLSCGRKYFWKRRQKNCISKRKWILVYRVWYCQQQLDELDWLFLPYRRLWFLKFYLPVFNPLNAFQRLSWLHSSFLIYITSRVFPHIVLLGVLRTPFTWNWGSKKEKWQSWRFIFFRHIVSAQVSNHSPVFSTTLKSKMLSNAFLISTHSHNQGRFDS